MHERGLIHLWTLAMAGTIVVLMGMTHSAQGFTVTQIANIENRDPMGSLPEGFTRFHNELVFSALDGMTGQELWRLE
jgi:hypothetical protein